MKWLTVVGTTLLTAGLAFMLAACGNPEEIPAENSSPASDDSSQSTTGPTGDPNSTYWTDERLQSAQPEQMPTVP
jgi:hypothetical protein